MQSLPTADWLTVTLPNEPSAFALGQLQDLLSSLPGVVPRSTPANRSWTVPDGGSFQLYTRGHSERSYLIVTASGSALPVLREAGLFDAYLRFFASFPYRVTRLDVALDLPVSAPPSLAHLHARANRGEFSLTRKRLDPSRHIHFIQSLDASGALTGTVYLGGRAAEIRARIYDKRHERVCKRRLDPGPWLRAELTVTDAYAPSLKDAYAPAPLFWHFMEPCLQGIATRPADVPAWMPGGSLQDFTLPARPARDPGDILRSRLERSQELRDLCAFAESVRGGAYLVYLRLRKLGLPVAYNASPVLPGLFCQAANGDFYATA